MFESFLGKQYSDNPRALYEYMSLTHPEYTLVWSADRNSAHVFEAADVPYIKRFSLSWMIQMNKATLSITNSRLPLRIPKPHGTLAPGVHARVEGGQEQCACVRGSGRPLYQTLLSFVDDPDE